METEHTLVLIKWLDITATAGWEPAEDVEPTEVQTLGWIAYQDDKVIKVGNSLGEDGEVYGISALPQGCVLSTTVLHVAPVRSQGPEVEPSESSEHLPSPTATVHRPEWQRTASMTEALESPTLSSD